MEIHNQIFYTTLCSCILSFIGLSPYIFMLSSSKCISYDMPMAFFHLLRHMPIGIRLLDSYPWFGYNFSQSYSFIMYHVENVIPLPVLLLLLDLHVATDMKWLFFFLVVGRSDLTESSSNGSWFCLPSQWLFLGHCNFINCKSSLMLISRKSFV